MFDSEIITISNIQTIKELENLTKDIANDAELLISHLLDNPHAFANYNDGYNPWHPMLAMLFPDHIKTIVNYTIENKDVFNRFFHSLNCLTIYIDLYPPEQSQKLMSFILNNSDIFERLVSGDIRGLINFIETFPAYKNEAFEKADLLNNPKKFKEAIYNGQTLLLAIEAFPEYARDFLDKSQILSDQQVFDHFIGAFNTSCFLGLINLFPQFTNAFIKRTYALDNGQTFMSSIFYSPGVHMFFDSVLKVFSTASIQFKNRLVEIILNEPTLFNYYLQTEQNLEKLSSLSPGCELLKIRPLEKIKFQLIAEANTRNAASIVGMWARSDKSSIAQIGDDACYQIAGFFAPSEKQGEKISKEHFGKPRLGNFPK